MGSGPPRGVVMVIPTGRRSPASPGGSQGSSLSAADGRWCTAEFALRREPETHAIAKRLRHLRDRVFPTMNLDAINTHCLDGIVVTIRVQPVTEEENLTFGQTERQHQPRCPVSLVDTASSHIDRGRTATFDFKIRKSLRREPEQR